jgi:hypothetical protein
VEAAMVLILEQALLEKMLLQIQVLVVVEVPFHLVEQLLLVATVLVA